MLCELLAEDFLAWGEHRQHHYSHFSLVSDYFKNIQLFFNFPFNSAAHSCSE
jgi:hypothetical protein